MDYEEMQQDIKRFAECTGITLTEDNFVEKEKSDAIFTKMKNNSYLVPHYWLTYYAPPDFLRISFEDIIKDINKTIEETSLYHSENIFFNYVLGGKWRTICIPYKMFIHNVSGILEFVKINGFMLVQKNFRFGIYYEFLEYDCIVSNYHMEGIRQLGPTDEDNRVQLARQTVIKELKEQTGITLTMEDFLGEDQTDSTKRILFSNNPIPYWLNTREEIEEDLRRIISQTEAYRSDNILLFLPQDNFTGLIRMGYDNFINHLHEILRFEKDWNIAFLSEDLKFGIHYKELGPKDMKDNGDFIVRRYPCEEDKDLLRRFTPDI